METAEFSTDPVIPAVPSAVVSSPARCDTECALKCWAAEPATCAAFVFVPLSKLCLISAEKPFSDRGNRLFRIIQQRSKGDLSFARSWTDCETGFGDGTDFWIGLKSIHELTGNSPKLLRVEAVTWSNILTVCEYSDFTVGDASTSYTMTFGSYLSGSFNTSEDSLTRSKGMKFLTMDRDNDIYGSSCSASYDNSGWWYSNCHFVNPKGIYHTSAVTDAAAMGWQGATLGGWVALKSIRLMLQVA